MKQRRKHDAGQWRQEQAGGDRHVLQRPKKVVISCAMIVAFTGWPPLVVADPKQQPPVVFDTVPALPSLSAALQYVEERKSSVALHQWKVFPIPGLKAAYLLFWKDTQHLLISSYRSGDPVVFDGLQFSELSMEGKVSSRGSYPYGTVGLSIYADRAHSPMRLWTLDTFANRQPIPWSVLVVEGEKVRLEKTKASFTSQESRVPLRGRFLRTSGQVSPECTNTPAETNPIRVVDILTTEYARFNLPGGTYRIDPGRQSLVIDTGTRYVGLLTTITSKVRCFPERPPTDLTIFWVPPSLKSNSRVKREPTFRVIPGEGDFLRQLRDKWKIRGWNTGSIERAELVNKNGAVVLRRDTRVEQDLWCSEIWYYDAVGKGTLIDFMVLVNEGGYLQRFVVDEQGEVVHVPHQSDYWGVGHNMIPALSPDGKRIAYLKWDCICIAKLPDH